ncbi:MAG: BrnT family toxin [Boseongicola sp.]|nr:BrnT family toxin [Boseongicola sp.]
MTNPRFTWDEDKNLSIQRKHGLSFEVAARAFLDPLQLSRQDRIEDGEQRWQTMGQRGQIDGLAIVVVAHTFTEARSVDEQVEVIRFISARPATRREGNRHEEG